MVRCELCPHECEVGPGERGLCEVRENTNGQYYSLVYANPCAVHIDPIEKKPLFHFHPGSTAFSIATAGCNFRCSFCQNADISQMPRVRGQILGHQATPQAVVRAAQRSGSQSIAYTYTEPTIFFEYAYDSARLASQAGIRNVFVTNGYMTPEMLETIGQDLHAALRRGGVSWADQQAALRRAGIEDRGAGLGEALFERILERASGTLISVQE